ncbi:MAG: 50S ribosomal protein L15e [Nanoarchaeota archaeon]|nr:50S ribosomal protein L15e [Nanoarchaeota archaeon]
MAAYKLIKKSIRENLKEKLPGWRNQNAVVKIEKPTDIGRARTLGYKAKKGIVIVRVRIKRGGHKRPRPRKGRRSKNLTIRKVLKMSYQWIAENRAARKFTNLEVLNSYKIAKDGKSYFFEIIMIDTQRPEIIKDKNYNWITKNKNKQRPERGLTTAAKKSRGLRTKSRQMKVRPSSRANMRQGK